MSIFLFRGRTLAPLAAMLLLVTQSAFGQDQVSHCFACSAPGHRWKFRWRVACGLPAET